MEKRRVNVRRMDTRVYIRLDDGLAEEVNSRAGRENRGISDVLRDMLRQAATNDTMLVVLNKSVRLEESHQQLEAQIATIASQLEERLRKLEAALACRTSPNRK